jgi:hypothetical protein
MLLRVNDANRLTINTHGLLGLGAEPANNVMMTISSDGSGANQPGIKFIDTNSGNDHQIYTNSGHLYFRDTTRGTTTVVVKNDGKVGIGTANPENYHGNGNDLVVYTSANTGMTIAGGSNSETCIFFADGTGGSDEATGGIVYQHASDIMRFNVQNDYPLFLGPKKIVGRTVMNLTSGANRWNDSGVWGNLGGSLASTANSLQNQASGCLYLCEASIQYLESYTASMLVFKNSAGGYQVIQINNTSGHMRMNGHYVQYKQNSGANQTGTSGFQRISAVMGTGTAS